MAGPQDTFAAVLRRYRRAAGLTQELLAEGAGLSVRTVSDLERGIHTTPHADTVRILADALGLDPAGADELEAAVPRRRGPPAGPRPGSRLSSTAWPLPLTPLVGREQDEAQLMLLHQQERVRLVTLTGAPGAGKTRLALQVGAELAAELPDGAVFVALASVRDPDLVLPTIAQTLQLRSDGGRPLLPVLIAALRDRAVLLVLDNCEQVLAAAPQLAELLLHCPQLTVLATSRAALQVRGEHEYPLAPLAVPSVSDDQSVAAVAQYAAVQLFVQRAQAILPHFTLQRENVPAVAAICRRLDGLPLAIELAVPRLRLLSPQALLARLEDRLALLTGGPRDLPARQQSLQAALAWSYDLLTPTQQRLLRCLGVFVGGCTVEAVATVFGLAAADSPILDGLTALAQQQLLTVRDVPGGAGTSRIVLLETVAEFAHQQLSKRAERVAVRRQHALVYAELAELAEPALLSARCQPWLARLGVEQENLRAALTWSAAQHDVQPGLRLLGALWFWFRFRSEAVAEGLVWAELLLSLPGAAPPTVARARALITGGFCAWRMGDIARARTWLEEGVQLGRSLPAEAVLGVALMFLAVVSAADRGHADALLEESAELFRRRAEPWLLALTLFHRGYLEAGWGSDTLAQASLQESVALYRAADDRAAAALPALFLGRLALRRGRHTEAQALFEACRDGFREAGDDNFGALTMSGLGELALQAPDPARAQQYFLASLDLARASGDPYQMGRALAGLVEVARLRERFTDAARLLALADVQFAAGGFRPPGQHHDEYAALRKGLRAHLSAAAFTAAYTSGQALPVTQVLTEG